METFKEANQVDACEVDLIISENFDLVVAPRADRTCSSLEDDVDQMHHVSVQFSTHHVYPLTCLWVKPVTDHSSGL